MLKEFCSLTGAEENVFKDNWREYEDLVFKYAPLEQKKSVKILLGQFAADERDDAGMEQKIIMCKNVFVYYVATAEYFSLTDKTCAYALDLLSALLGTNRSGGQSVVSIFEVHHGFYTCTSLGGQMPLHACHVMATQVIQLPLQLPFYSLERGGLPGQGYNIARLSLSCKTQLLQLCNSACVTFMQGESVDIESCLADMNIKAPFIAAFGVTRNDISDVKVIVELDNIIPVFDMHTAIHFCFASYYVFNIAYPPSFKNLLIFLERYVYFLKSTTKLPLCVSVLHDGLDRIRNS